MKINLYATQDNGEGYVSSVGTFDDIEEVEIRIGAFARDVVLTFETEED